jgi:3-isopropylmalate dehydrogenase
MKNSAFDIAVLAGDGIGVEVMEACLAVLAALAGQVGGIEFSLARLPGGAREYAASGTALSEAAFERCGRADAVLFGAMGWPDIRYPDGTEIAPQLELRTRFGLYAGMRPIKAIPGIPLALADRRAAAIDFVVIRESTEGLFASRGKGVVEDDREARDTMVITRPICERLFDAAFRLAGERRARGRPGLVTCVDKANVFRSMAFFRKIFDERAGKFPKLRAAHHYIDATALDLVRRPWDFDVLVTENMFGDILSDLGAALIGGMGFAPSADIGDDHAVFQPCHGSAPDIAGTGKANPTAMFLSAAMMLDWLGRRHRHDAALTASRLLEAAVAAAFAGGSLRTAEFGGADGTEAVTRAVIERIRAPATPG